MAMASAIRWALPPPARRVCSPSTRATSRPASSSSPGRTCRSPVDYYNIRKTGVIAPADYTPALTAYFAGQPIPNRLQGHSRPCQILTIRTSCRFGLHPIWIRQPECAEDLGIRLLCPGQIPAALEHHLDDGFRGHLRQQLRPLSSDGTVRALRRHHRTLQHHLRLRNAAVSRQLAKHARLRPRVPQPDGLLHLWLRRGGR